MIKSFTLATAAALSLGTAAAADSAFSFTDSEITGSTIELGQVRAAETGTIAIYDFHRGVQGALLGTEAVSAGANYDVRIPLGKPPVNDVVAVLTVDGQIADTRKLDVAR